MTKKKKSGEMRIFSLDGERRDAEEQRLPSSVLPSLEGRRYRPGRVTAAGLCLSRWRCHRSIPKSWDGWAATGSAQPGSAPDLPGVSSRSSFPPSWVCCFWVVFFLICCYRTGRGEAGPRRFSSFFSLIRLSARPFGEKAANSEEDGGRKQPGEARPPAANPRRGPACRSPEAAPILRVWVGVKR